ncbi:hypothetical protein Trydic_g21842, partial [Trypoxylus dichotomus]
STASTTEDVPDEQEVTTEGGESDEQEVTTTEGGEPNEDGSEPDEEEVTPPAGGESDEDGSEPDEEEDTPPVGGEPDDGDIPSDGSCPPTGQYFLPHPYVCAQFIECNNGESSIIDCIDGLHFNPAVGWCDFPENVGCVDSTPAPPITEVPEEEGGPVGECPPVNGAYVDFLTDSRDCTIFYKCDWGTPIQMNCPSGLHFNPTLNVCDWPAAAGCTAGQ